MNISNQKIEWEDTEEISNFIQNLLIISPIHNKSMVQAWKNIRCCIAGYLIKEAYIKINEKQKSIFSKNFDEIQQKKWTTDDYIELRLLGIGSQSKVELIYHIEKEELLAIKKTNQDNIECFELFEREKSNYLKLDFPLLPKFYGIVKVNNINCLIIQFINGHSLLNIRKDEKNERIELNDDEKMAIIFQMILIIDYFHKKKLVYRDLKPNNIIIDENKNIFIIDFDRLIEIDNKDDEQNHTNNFSSPFVDPLVNSGNISYSNDIYSIGQMIYYIINEEFPDQQIENEVTIKSENKKIQQIYKKCHSDKIEERPTIQELNKEVFQCLSSQQKSKMLQIIQKIILLKKQQTIHLISDQFNKSLTKNSNNPEVLFSLGLNYLNPNNHQDIDKAIHYFTLAANQNDTRAQYCLGVIYSTKKDINKSIHYFSLAADKNHIDSLNNLGFIYSNGKYIKPDIKKSIHYFTLAANQNDQKAQYSLGLIYLTGKFVKIDINKSIQYFSLAANQNNSNAQYSLAAIYYNGNHITRDVKKAIHYFTLAANNGDIKAQYYLGLIYKEGKYVNRDLTKSIHYFYLAAKRNNSESLFNLGLIYSEKEYGICDINKSIFFYTLAAKLNHVYAQYNLGVIYYEGNYVIRDINKSIYYFSLAAKQNDHNSQFGLGVIFASGKYVNRNINKAIQYFTLAANQKNSDALNYLGEIYLEGKYVTRDIYKAIYYLTLAANLNHQEAQFQLGVIYSDEKYVPINIDKSLHFFRLAANQNNKEAQFILGNLYSIGLFVEKNFLKGIDYLIQSASNKNIEASFEVGYFYHEGKFVTRDIVKCLNYYKEASSFNNQYAKNNIGIIYKNGFGDEIPKNVEFAKIFFDEAIKQKNDKISMYNLAHIFIYEENDKIDQSIDLLIKSSNLGFSQANELLCIALIKNNGFDIDNIRKEINRRGELSAKICKMINLYKLLNELNYLEIYQYYKEIDYLYNFIRKPIIYKKIFEEKKSDQQKNKNCNNITSDFYEGFGICLH